MAVGLIAQAVYFVGHQIPLFLLAFGVLMLVLAKALGEAIAVPIGVVTIAASLAWFTMTGGSIFALPIDVMEVVALGIVVLVVGRAFAG